MSTLFFDWLGSLFRVLSHFMLSSLWHGTVSLLLFTVSPHLAENSCFKQVKKKVEKKEDFRQFRVERPGWLSKSCRAVSFVKFPKKRSLINKSSRINQPIRNNAGRKSIRLHQNKGIPRPRRSHGSICREEGQSSTNKSSGPLPGQHPSSKGDSN